MDKKIVKYGGHCYDGTGWIECGFWVRPEVANPDRPITKCALFGNTEKHASRSLKCCNVIYGNDYEGEP